jgi:hypothetical protein
MKKLRMPRHKLIKKMNNLILDNQAEDIKLLLYKNGQSIPSLYDDINFLLEKKKCSVAESTFKNMLMDSDNQNYDWVKRLKVVNLIFEYLNHKNIESEYADRKLSRSKKIRRIMEVLKSDYEDINDYDPIEVILHEIDNLPEGMKTYWEDWRDEKI